MHVLCLKQPHLTSPSLCPHVTTGNANAANGALTKGRVCATLQKTCTPLLMDVQQVIQAFSGTFQEFYYLVRQCLWKNTGFSLTVTGWSQEGHPAVKFATMYDMTVFNAVQCERRSGNHQVEVVLNSRVGVRCEHRHIVSQLSYQNFRLCSWNFGTMRD